MARNKTQFVSGYETLASEMTSYSSQCPHDVQDYVHRSAQVATDRNTHEAIAEG